MSGGEVSTLGETTTDEHPVVAGLVAAVGQLVKQGLGHRETPTALGHRIGHGHRSQVDDDRRAVVGEVDVHLIVDHGRGHPDPQRLAPPGVFDDVGAHLGGGDRHLHPHVIGQPFRIRALRDFLDYAKKFDDVWFATREEIAEWYLENHSSHIG